MTGPEWIQALGGLAAGVAAVLAWVAKIRWSKEYRAAKEAHVQALEEKASLYEAASSPLLLQRYKEMKLALEEEIKRLQEDLQEAEREFEEREAALAAALRQTEEIGSRVTDMEAVIEARARESELHRARAEALARRVHRLNAVAHGANQVLYGEWSDAVSIHIDARPEE